MPQPPSDPPSSTRGGMIVVADDDRLTRELLAGMLRARGHQVDAVADGQAAVERVARGGVQLVLLDVLMPRLGGLEACRLLKGMTAGAFLPVVLVTVKTDSQSRVEGLKIGADDYVCKPFDEAELMARVEAMLRIKRLHDHVADARQRLDQLSIHDDLTGLYNYRHLQVRLGEEYKRAERHRESLACMAIDIDRLQLHNEAGGRAHGDRVIRHVADTIRLGVREADVLARFGGDEFLMVLPGLHFAGAVAVAERVFRELGERPVPGDGARMPVTVSAGVALFPSRDVRTRDSLLRSADLALSVAKREGGARVCVYQQEGQIYTPLVGSPGGADQGRGQV
jgi:two-component system cell cycle response regulator